MDEGGQKEIKLLIGLLVLSLVIPLYPNCLISTAYPTIPDAPISQEFRYLPKGGTLPHVGVDFKVPTGTQVYATKWGIIIGEGIDRVYGRYLEILHIDGYMSLYGHLSSFILEEGDFVGAGTLIALSGGDPEKDPKGAGWSIVEHLHYEVRVPDHLDNNLYNIDPLKYLGLDNEE